MSRTSSNLEMHTLYYAHDPMCSWCWAFSPALQYLFDNLPDNIQFVSLLGGLAKDSMEHMPEETKEYVQNHWRNIQEEVPGTEFNFDFWRVCKPRRSTYPACRAVIAARIQGNQFDPAMTQAIQQAYYLQARNPSDIKTLIELAGEIGLDKDKFSSNIKSEETESNPDKRNQTMQTVGLKSFSGFITGNKRNLFSS